LCSDPDFRQAGKGWDFFRIYLYFLMKVGYKCSCNRSKEPGEESEK
jgi:hypothetical protein